MGGTLANLAVGGAVKTAHTIDWGALITRVGVPLGVIASLATIIAIFPMTRNGALWAWHALLMRAGLPYRRYARKFIDRYGTYDNPYLRVREKRDLRTTYVPLSFQSDDGQKVAVATDVLTNLPTDRLVVVGDPGSGKSTLVATAEVRLWPVLSRATAGVRTAHHVKGR